MSKTERDPFAKPTSQYVWILGSFSARLSGYGMDLRDICVLLFPDTLYGRTDLLHLNIGPHEYAERSLQPYGMQWVHWPYSEILWPKDYPQDLRDAAMDELLHGEPKSEPGIYRTLCLFGKRSFRVGVEHWPRVGMKVPPRVCIKVEIKEQPKKNSPANEEVTK